MNPFEPLCCATCIFWVRGGSPISNARINGVPHPDTGTCQSRAPVVINGQGLVFGVWPETHQDRCCGDYVGEDEGDPPPGDEAEPGGTVVHAAPKFRATPRAVNDRLAAVAGRAR